MARAITVVVPTLNSGQTLDWTLLSLRKQISCEVTIIVVDSGSTDETLRICAHWQVETVYEPPGNMYRAINTGLRLAKTTWVTYLNSDDLVYSTAYARLIELGEKTDTDVVYGTYDAVDWEGRFIYSYAPGRPHELHSQFMNSQLSFAQPAAIFTRKLHSDLGGFDEQYRYAADLDFFLRAAVAGYRFVMLSGPTVASFRIHRKQSSQNIAQITNETRHIQSRYGKPNPTLSLPTVRWRLRNWPHYFLRILRRHTLDGQWRIVRSMDTGNEAGQ